MFIDQALIEGCDPAVLAVVIASGKQAGLGGWRPAFGIAPGAVAQHARRARRCAMQPQGTRATAEQAQGAVGVRRRLQPGEIGVGAIHREPIVERRADDAALIPALRLVQRRAAGENSAHVGWRRDAARHHVRGMRPLTAEMRDDLHHATRDRERFAIDRAAKGLEGFHQRGPPWRAHIARVTEIRGEKQKGLPQVVLNAFGHQTQVAYARGIRRNGRFPGVFERKHRRIEMRRPANAADPGRDDHGVARRASDEDLLEAANMMEGEKVQIVNNNNGERFETYTIRGERGSGVICLNGAAARRVQVGDIVIIISYAYMTPEEAKNFKGIAVFPDENNRLVINNNPAH